MSDWSYGLRTINGDRTSGNKWLRTPFVWPPFDGSPVRVEATDWDPTPECGGGIHVLHRGRGDADHLHAYRAAAIYQVVRYPRSLLVDMGDKGKVPWVEIIFEGARADAVAYLIGVQGSSAGVVYATITGGDYATLIGGDGATLTGGFEATLIGGRHATLTGGTGATLTGGDGATLTGGHYATLTGGDGATLTGGDGATLTGGCRATLTGGYRATLTGGDYATLIGGDESTLTGGYGATLTGGRHATLTGGRHATLTGGDGATLICVWYEGLRTRIVVANVSADGPVKPGVAYSVRAGEWAERRQGNDT